MAAAQARAAVDGGVERIVDNLGELKRSGSQFINTKIDVTTPLEPFALIVTAEPHFLVRRPSRAVFPASI